MKTHMTKGLLSALTLIGAMALGQQASAAAVVRADFGSTAVNFDFQTATEFASTASNGTVTVTTTGANGGVIDLGALSPAGPITGKYFVPGVTTSPFNFGTTTLSFSSGVSAVGFDFLSIPDVFDFFSLSIFNQAGALLGTALQGSALTSTAINFQGTYFEYGFFGLESTSNDIFSAVLSFTGNAIPGGLGLDNIVYESITATNTNDPGNGGGTTSPTNQVPEPATALLMGAGLLGWAVARKRRQAA
jgi:hypothetical protein